MLPEPGSDSKGIISNSFLRPNLARQFWSRIGSLMGKKKIYFFYFFVHLCVSKCVCLIN